MKIFQSILFIAVLVFCTGIECLAREEGSAQTVIAEGAYKPFGYPWENNTLGISGDVPQPWTALAYDGAKVGCWGRDFNFERGILPRQITSQGDSIFAREASLEIVVDGRRLGGLSGTVPVQRVKSAGRAEFTISSVEGNCRLEGTSTLEYDGFLRVDFAVIPLKPAKIDSITLSLPIERKVARFYSSYIHYDFEKQVPVREIMSEGIGPIENRIEFGFNPAVWVGNEKIGIEWSCESNIGWSSSDPSREIEIEPKGDTVILRVKFVSKPVMATGPLQFSFALYPTPVKKLPDNWRQKVLVPAFQKPQNISPQTHDIFGIAMGLPVKHPGLPLIEPSEKEVSPGGGVRPQNPRTFIDNTRARMNQAGIKFVPYSSLYGMTARLPRNEWKDYAQQWRTMSGRGDSPNRDWAAWADIPPGEPSILSVCLFPKSIRDFYVWSFVEGIKKYNTDGMYLDLTGPLSLCQNRNHPHGESVAKGARYYPFFAQRELMKRLYSACKSLKPDFQIILHQAKIPVVCSGFSDMALSGEFMSTRFLKGREYDPDYGKFPDSFYGVQFLQTRGFAVVLHPQIIKWDRERLSRNPELLRGYTQSLLARTAVFDIPLYPGRMDIALYEKYLGAWKRFGWSENTTFAGPAESARYVTGKANKIKIGLYLKPKEGKLMIAAANLGKNAEKEEFSLNFEELRRAGLSLRKDYSLLEAVENKPHDSKDGKINISLAPNEYIFLIVQ